QARPLKVQDSFPEVGPTISNQNLVALFDEKAGTIRQLIDLSKGGRIDYTDLKGSMGRLELHQEEPHGMSAWTLGRITKVSDIPVVEVKEGKNSVSFVHRMDSQNNPSKPTTIIQTFTLLPDSDRIEVDVEADWNHIGNGRTGVPLLRAAFDTNLENPKATYEVPFGAINRPTDGKEVVGLNWQDLSDGTRGVAILNDSKHGMSADGSTMRLSLIRSSYDPDTNPNPGYHRWRYAIVPHEGGWREARIPQKGYEFQQPMLVMQVPFEAKGSNPLEWGLLKVEDPAVVPTALKRSEDGNDVVLRMYQSTGARSDGTIEFARRLGGATWVNFIEDRLGNAPARGNSLPLSLRGYEIRTIRARLE
ncbi:MAG TPA: glycoside hydrolase family 38 C-terminal domain-containing protein, partial [Fimbriimonas sp.]